MTARELSPEFNILFHIIGLLYRCMIETLNIISDGQEMIPFTKQIFDSSIDLDKLFINNELFLTYLHEYFCEYHAG